MLLIAFVGISPLLKKNGQIYNPNADLRNLKEKVPKDLALLILSFLKHEVVPWDSFDLWVPEFDRDGNYAYLPMCPIDLPMW